MNTVYKDYISFSILGEEINFICNETSYGKSSVAEMNALYFHLDNDLPAFTSAILLWQDIKCKDLSNEEIYQILVDNQKVLNKDLV